MKKIQLLLAIFAFYLPSIIYAVQDCSDGTDMSYKMGSTMANPVTLANTTISYTGLQVSMSGTVVINQGSASQITYTVTKGVGKGDDNKHLFITLDGVAILDYNYAQSGTGYSSSVSINPGAHTLTAWLEDYYYRVKSKVITVTTSNYTTGNTIHQYAYANKAAVATLGISAGYGAGSYALEAYDSSSGWMMIGQVNHDGTAKQITINNATSSWSDNAGSSGTSTIINPCHALYRWRKLTGSSFVGYTGNVTMPYTVYDFGANTYAPGFNPSDLTSGTTGLDAGSDGPLVSPNNNPTQLTYNGDGTTTYKDTQLPGDKTVDVTGTDTDQLNALNKQTGISTSQLSVLSDIRDEAEKIAGDVGDIADKPVSSGGGGGLTTDQSDDLSQIADDVHDMREKTDDWASLTSTDDADGKQADLIDNRKSNIGNVAEAAGTRINNAFAAQGLSGSLDNPGVTTPTGSDGDMWNVTIGGMTVNLSPYNASGDLMTWIMYVRTILAWVVLGYFYMWYVDTVKERITALVLVPTPVANTNPQGVAGAITNMTKVAIWVVLIMTLPALFAAIPLAVDSINDGGVSLWTWITGFGSGGSGGSGGSVASFAWHWIQTMFPLTVMVNCFILRVTAALYMGTVVGFSFWVVKQSTAY